MKKSAIVETFSKRIKQLETDFDFIADELKKTAMVKAEYDTITDDLCGLIEYMKQQGEVL